MALSRQAGEPQKIGAMQSIADSLMAPHTDEFSFRVCQDNIDTLVTVNDDQIRAGMHFLFNEFKMATEPACAVATAALMFPLRKHLAGQRVGVLFCGSNTDTDTFIRHVTTPLAQG
jgi:threonine dehydratase